MKVNVLFFPILSLYIIASLFTSISFFIKINRLTNERDSLLKVVQKSIPKAQYPYSKDIYIHNIHYIIVYQSETQSSIINFTEDSIINGTIK